jgi:hypothetical protein
VTCVVEPLEPLPLARRPDAVEEALAARALELRQDVVAVVGPGLGPLVAVEHRGVGAVGRVPEGGVPRLDPLAEPVRRVAGVGVAEQEAGPPRATRAAEPPLDRLPAVLPELDRLVDEDQVPVGRGELVGLVEASRDDRRPVGIVVGVADLAAGPAREPLHAVQGEEPLVGDEDRLGEALAGLAEEQDAEVRRGAGEQVDEGQDAEGLARAGRAAHEEVPGERPRLERELQADVNADVPVGVDHRTRG